MSEKALRVCVVGCGDMGRTHARCWSALPEASVVALVDIQEDRAAQLASQTSAMQVYRDYRQAIDRPEVNVVSICIPTHLHAEVMRYAAQRGKHVLTEKPIALNIQDADAMLAAARQNHVQFSVGLMRYHSPVLAALKQWLDAECKDQPVVYWASDIREIRPKREMHDTAANGGPVIDMAVHLFATWQYLFDAPVKDVHAHGFTFAANRPELAQVSQKAVDTASISVHYQSGDVGQFLVSWGVPPGVVPDPLPEVILTARGILHARFAANHQEVKLQREGGAWETLASSDENMYQREIQDFAQAILQNRPPRVSGELGRAALETSLAAMESINQNRS